MGAIRVLHVHHGLAPGGAPASLLRLLQALNPARVSSTVVLPGPGPLSRTFRGAGFSVRHLPLAAFYYLAHQPRVKLTTRIRHTALAPITRHLLGRLLDRERFDLVHLNTSIIPVCGETAARRGLPVLWHVREVIPPDDPAARRRLLEAARSHASAIVAISAAAAAPFREIGPVRVIHEGVPVDAWWRPAARLPVRQALGAGPDDVVLLYPATLNPYKGQATLLEALPEALRVAPRLVVWFAGGEGRRGERVALQARAARLGVAGRVRWLGWRDDMPDLMAASDLVAFLPVREEGFGLPLIEAMAAGRPVITLDRGPAPEIVAHGRTGFLVGLRGPVADAEEATRKRRSADAGLETGPEDAAAVAGAVARLALDGAARERVGRAARAEAEQRFDLSRMARAFEEVFERTARRGGPRPFPV